MGENDVVILLSECGRKIGETKVKHLSSEVRNMVIKKHDLLLIQTKNRIERLELHTDTSDIYQRIERLIPPEIALPNGDYLT